MRNPPETLIEHALGMSRYARRLVDAAPAMGAQLQASLHTPWDQAQMLAVLNSLPTEDEAALKKALRVLRKQVMLRLIVRDLAGLADLQEVMTTASTASSASNTAHRLAKKAAPSRI